MLATRRYPQWKSGFLRYIDTLPNSDALRKCILKGLYQPTTVTILAVPSTENSLAVLKQTAVETILTMSPENKAHYESEKEEIHLLLTGIRDEIYSTEFGKFTSHNGESIESYYSRFYKMINEMIRNNLTFPTMQVNVQFLQQLQPEWSRFVTIVKQQHDLDTVSNHKLFDVLKQYQKEVNKIHAERIAKNANTLARVAATQQYPDPYYQAPKSHKLYATQPKALLPTRSHATTKHKGKEIAKPITPPFESAFEEDSDLEQAQINKDMQKKLALIAKYFKKIYKPTNNNLKTSSNSKNKNVDTTLRKPKRVKEYMYHKEKMLLCKQAEKGVPLQVEQADWLEDTDEEVDEHELEAHYSFMEKIQEVPTVDSGTDTEPLEQDDSNVTPDSPDMCDNDIQTDQNAKDKRVALANLFANLKLDEVIVNGDSVTAVASARAEGPIPPKTAKQKLARKNELKTKSTLMLAIPNEYLLKFRACKDAKSLWEAIKNRFGGNKKSKKTQKIILKQNYENFAASSQEGLDKPMIDTLSMDDLYNNLKVYKSKIKIQSSLSSNSHNVTFVSSDNTSSTNEIVNTTHNVSVATSKDQASTASYADDVMLSIFSNQFNALQLDNKDLEQINTDDLEEMDLKWQVAMLTIRVKRRGYFSKECRAPRNQGNRNRDAPTRNAPVDASTTNALVVQDGIGGYDWSFQAKEELINFALMAHTSSSNSEVHTCSKECLKSYNALQKQYDQQCETLNKSNLEIIGYQIGLESLKARIVVHEKNEAIYEEDIAFLKYDVQVKDISIKDLKNQLENALKEKDDLKLKLEKFETSSRNLTKLIDSQISATGKAGLGYDGHVNESEVLNNVVDSCESDGKDNQVNDRFKKSKGYHVVLPPYTRNYMPSRADLSFVGLDDYVIKFKVSETITSVPKIEPNASKTSKDSLEKPKTVRNTTVENENKAEKPRKFSQGPRVLTKSRNVPVNTAKQSSQRAAASVSTARHVNTATSRPNVNSALPTKYSYFKAHSPVRRPFNQKSAAKTNNFNEKFNTDKDNPQYALQDQGIFNSGSSRHMTGNKSYLTDYQEINGGFVAFEEMLKEKNNVLFTDTECVVLSPDFKLFDESQVLLKVPKNNNMYSFDLKNVVLVGGLTCLFAKATLDESNLWHRRLSHINFKTINKLVKGNLARGLPSKIFENNHTCVSCQKGKQHKASCPKSSKDAVADDSRKKSTEVLRKKNGVKDPIKEGRERAQRNEFKSMFGQDKDVNDNRMFTPVSVAGSTYVYLGGSIIMLLLFLMLIFLLILSCLIWRILLILESLVVPMMMNLSVQMLILTT
nr:hypothetical protein [Tanacetum cinerariifolium]